MINNLLATEVLIMTALFFGQIFNFESDPYKLRRKIETEFINPGNGWNKTNTCLFRFSKQFKKSISAYEITTADNSWENSWLSASET